MQPIDKYSCKVCEEFFILPPYAPTRCPMCFADARYILGPIPVQEYDISELKRAHDKKYNKASRR